MTFGLGASLKPCPFCGGEPRKRKYDDCSCSGVVCDECDATIGHYATESQVIAAWNRRARPPLSTGEYAELVGRLEKRRQFPNTISFDEGLLRDIDEAISALRKADTLSARVEVQREALEPFANVAAEVDKFGGVDNDHYQVGFGLTFGDVRRARTVLASLEHGGEAGGERYRHRKRGSTYIKIGNAHLQTDTPLEDMAVLIVYKSEHDGTLWVRAATEFFDGRFEALSASPARPAGMGDETPSPYDINPGGQYQP